MELEDYEACYHITSEDFGGGYWAYVSKVGGGTVGRYYTGEQWFVALVDSNDEELDTLFTGKIQCGIETNHYGAALDAVTFFEAGAE